MKNAGAACFFTLLIGCQSTFLRKPIGRQMPEKIAKVLSAVAKTENATEGMGLNTEAAEAMTARTREKAIAAAYALLKKNASAKHTVALMETGGIHDVIEKWAKDGGVNTYSVMAGDETGIRFIKQVGKETGFIKPNRVAEPLLQYSVGKWAAAASLGAAVKKGLFAWDDKVHKFIEWWPKDATFDGRAKITFRHLMSLTSGLVADTAMAMALQAAGIQGEINHADLGWQDESINLETVCKRVLAKTPTTINPPEAFRYGETHFLVAQLAALKAERMHGYKAAPRWMYFFHKYWGSHLGLERARILMHNGHIKAGRYFEEEKDPKLAYGFHINRQTTFAQNPDSGSQLIVSPCAYSRFMREQVIQGEALYGTESDLDMKHTSTGDFQPLLGSYSLGHWVYDTMSPKIYHSQGYAGSNAIVSTLKNGKKFWVYLNLYEAEGGLAKGALFLMTVVYPLRDLLSDSATCGSCVGCMRGGRCYNGKKANPTKCAENLGTWCDAALTTTCSNENLPSSQMLLR